MNSRQRPSIFQVNLFYLVLAIIFIKVGSLVQGMDEMKGLLFTEYIIILFPSLLFVMIKRLPMKKFLRLNKISFKQSVLVIIITLFAYPLVLFVQGVFIIVLDSFTQFIPNQIPIPINTQGFIYGIFTMSITAGICEEIMFRGVIMGVYDKLGYKKSIIITAALFGIFHFTLVNFMGPFILGIIFGIMVHKTNSIYSAIIGHAVNNAIALSILFSLDKYTSIANNVLIDEGSMRSNNSDIILSVMGLLFLSLCYSIVKKSFSHLGDITDDTAVNPEDLVIDEFEEIVIYKESFNPIKYLPVLIVVIMFFYINFKYIISLT